MDGFTFMWEVGIIILEDVTMLTCPEIAVMLILTMS